MSVAYDWPDSPRIFRRHPVFEFERISHIRGGVETINKPSHDVIVAHPRVVMSFLDHLLTDYVVTVDRSDNESLEVDANDHGQRGEGIAHFFVRGPFRNLLDIDLHDLGVEYWVQNPYMLYIRQ